MRGSHIVVPKIFAHERCYIFQNADGRIIFAIPYERDFTLIGTTDEDHKGAPGAVAASEDEINYLCAAASEYFAAPVARADVVWTYSGVRPLYDDGASAAQAATRDYVLVPDTAGGAPLLSVFGGKITTFRRLAEHALEKLYAHLPSSVRADAGWTSGAALPGGDFPCTGFDALMSGISARHPYLPQPLARRLARAYGTRADDLLGDSRSMADLGEIFGADLSAAEVRYLMRAEWALEADDILWRRGKLGLRFSADQRAALEAFMLARTEAA